MGRVYDLQDWERTRRAKLSANPLCEHCLARGKVVPATEVDHIQPISKGGEWFNPDNLQCLCKSCHSLKTKRDEGANVRLGCDQNGLPIDAAHHWNTGG